MAKYWQPIIAGYGEVVSVEFETSADVIESIVAGDDEVDIHGQINKRVRGTIECEEYPTGKAHTAATDVVMTFTDIAAVQDKPLTFPKVEYLGISGGGKADDTNPVRFRIAFVATLPASGL